MFGGLLQYPGTSGAVRDLRPAISALHGKGALAIVAADLLALTLLASPGELGADIAIGSAQRFGVPMGYGGPHAAYMAVRDALKRSLPGRIVGLSVDSRGAPAYRLALQTREQHIRREKATSNICTAQVLLAVIASMYAVYHGPEGLTAIARSIHRRTAVLAAGLRKLGFAPASDAFFDTVTVDVGGKRDEIVARARCREDQSAASASAGSRVALDETTTSETVEAVWRAFGGKLSYAEIEAGAREALPMELKRLSRFLTHPVFQAHRSETEMLRYMRKLSDRDLALDRAMIPLGLLHHEAERDHGNDPADLAAIRAPASVRAAPSRPTAITRCSSACNNGCATSPAMTRSRCSRTPARKANMRDCSRSAAITPRAAKAIARCA